MFYVEMIQIILKEIVKSPIDADQPIDVSVLVQVFDDL